MSYKIQWKARDTFSRDHTGEMYFSPGRRGAAEVETAQEALDFCRQWRINPMSRESVSSSEDTRLDGIFRLIRAESKAEALKIQEKFSAIIAEMRAAGLEVESEDCGWYSVKIGGEKVGEFNERTNVPYHLMCAERTLKEWTT